MQAQFKIKDESYIYIVTTSEETCPHCGHKIPVGTEVLMVVQDGNKFHFCDNDHYFRARGGKDHSDERYCRAHPE